MNRLLTFRPAACRVRKSSSPDAGYNVCRIPDAVKDLIGIEWGDRVVIQSANARLPGMKALPIREGLAETYETRIEARPDRDPPSCTETEAAQKAGLIADLQTVYLSASARSELQLLDDGRYQPVKIHRDTTDVFLRLFDKLSIPLVLGAATIIVGFDISSTLKLVTLCVALLVGLVSISLHDRRILLRKTEEKASPCQGGGESESRFHFLRALGKSLCHLDTYYQIPNKGKNLAGWIGFRLPEGEPKSQPSPGWPRPSGRSKDRRCETKSNCPFRRRSSWFQAIQSPIRRTRSSSHRSLCTDPSNSSKRHRRFGPRYTVENEHVSVPTTIEPTSTSEPAQRRYRLKMPAPPI